ncbi:HAMP domain-containing sensor histidine kinase [Sphingomonas prati]|uniref:histidine kinase n=1 Tax=Sphingomonas prati TaxID=1843237 RepID=A0A7W9F1A3_9SPHN|nr:ATP-binding protein [Sphingomonas prati]MBB5729093.1 signal transduction histidine kinase [Sphingomonas prati]GGE85182.1 two-component sensor histidine kinase [Sphingomonas prati]
MIRFLPRSLGGQMALLLGLALLVAQIANVALILNERQKLTLAQNQGPAIDRFAGVAADLAAAAPEFRAALLADASHRGARFAYSADSGIPPRARNAAVEARLADALADLDTRPAAVRAAITRAPEPPRLPGANRARPPESAERQLMILAVRGREGRWLTARIITPPRDPRLGIRLGAATLLLYLIVLGASIVIAMRLARPLRDLTRAADAFGGRGDPVAVPVRGPDDLRHAIVAFNAMNARVVALLDEKDRMLGAIGHDLRTPLASLRIRIEGMDPAEERVAAIATIDESTAMLEDILVLARTGRVREDARRMDVAALVEALVEDYRDMGRAVAFTPGPRAIADVQPVLLRRAVRNLVDNALAYATTATLSVAATADAVIVSIADDGPGIPPADRARMMQPFQRQDSSRNRDTGGTGLGLAIARSIAEGHGGTLTLGEAEGGGLLAEIRLPVTR